MAQPIAALTGAPEQRTQSVALSICRIKSVALPDQGAQGTVLPGLGPQTVSHSSSSMTLARQGSKFAGPLNY